MKEALEKGQDRSGIRSALMTAGWREQEVDEALETYSDVAFPVAVPKPSAYLSAREAFFYLLFFILLGVLFRGLLSRIESACCSPLAVSSLPAQRHVLHTLRLSRSASLCKQFGRGSGGFCCQAPPGPA